MVAAAHDNGPFEILAEKSRIAFHDRISFAAFMPRRQWLAGHLLLPDPVPSDHFTRITTYSRNNHVGEFRLRGADDVDAEMRALLSLAQEYGSWADR